MKTIKNWQQFNEENIYGPGWTTTTTGIPEKPVQQPNKPVQQPDAQPDAQPGDTYFYHFYIPCAVEKSLNDEEIFGYYDDPREICQKLEEKGFVDCWWFEDQFIRWKEYAKPEEPVDEPIRDDFESDEEYASELDEWTERINEYDNWQPSIEQYIKDEWDGKFDKFLAEFEISGPVCDIATNREQQNIFNELKSDFNDSDLVQYFDDAERLGITSIKVIGSAFDNSEFTVEIESTKKVEEIDIVKGYLEGQCSDGFGEGFEQQNIEGYSVHTWWSGNQYDAGKYEILTTINY